MALNRKSKRDTQRPWRPDFRDVQSLPDTKVVRTNFLFNFIGVIVSIGLLILVAYQELSIHTVSGERQALQQQVQSATSQNRQLLELNRRWLQHSAVGKEAVDFVSVPMDYVGVLEQLARQRPEGLIYRSINLTYMPVERGKKGSPPFRMQLSGKITGRDTATPSDIIARLQDDLRELPDLKDRILEMSVRQFDRDSELSVFSFTLEVRIDSNQPKAS